MDIPELPRGQGNRSKELVIRADIYIALSFIGS